MNARTYARMYDYAARETRGDQPVMSEPPTEQTDDTDGERRGPWSVRRRTQMAHEPRDPGWNPTSGGSTDPGATT
jgi:hypothetical protein